MFKNIALTSLAVAGVSATAVLGSANMASAATFNFSFSNVTGAINGTVSGTVVLPDGDGTFAATSVTITSAPAGLGYDPTTTNFATNAPQNIFSVVGGNINVANTFFVGLFNPSTALSLKSSLVGGSTFLDALNAVNNGATGVQDATNSTLTFSPASVPEPGTILGLLAVGSLGALTRKSKG